MRLVLVESFTKSKTLFKLLNEKFPKQWKVISTDGRLIDICKTQKLTVLKNDESLNFVVRPKSEDLLANILDVAKDCEVVHLCFDDTPEGEFLSWSLSNELKKVKESDKIRRNILGNLDSGVFNRLKSSSAINTQLAIGYGRWLALDFVFQRSFGMGALTFYVLRALTLESTNTVYENKYRPLAQTTHPGLSLKFQKSFSTQEEAYSEIDKISKELLKPVVCEKTNYKNINIQTPLPCNLLSLVTDSKNILKDFQAALSLYHSGLISDPRTDGTGIDESTKQKYLDFLNKSFLDVDYSRKLESDVNGCFPLSVEIDFSQISDNWRSVYIKLWQRAVLASINYDKVVESFDFSALGFSGSLKCVQYKGYSLFESEQEMPQDVSISNIVLSRETNHLPQLTKVSDLYSDFDFLGIDCFLESMKFLSEKNLIKIVGDSCCATQYGLHAYGFVVKKYSKESCAVATCVADILKDFTNDGLFRKFFDVLFDINKPDVLLFRDIDTHVKRLLRISNPITQEVCDKCGNNLVLKSDSLAENCYFQCKESQCQAVYPAEYSQQTITKAKTDFLVKYDCEQVSFCKGKEHTMKVTKFSKYLQCTTCNNQIIVI